MRWLNSLGVRVLTNRHQGHDVTEDLLMRITQRGRSLKASEARRVAFIADRVHRIDTSQADAVDVLPGRLVEDIRTLLDVIGPVEPVDDAGEDPARA